MFSTRQDILLSRPGVRSENTMPLISGQQIVLRRWQNIIAPSLSPTNIKYRVNYFIRTAFISLQNEFWVYNHCL